MMNLKTQLSIKIDEKMIAYPLQLKQNNQMFNYFEQSFMFMINPSNINLRKRFGLKSLIVHLGNK